MEVEQLVPKSSNQNDIGHLRASASDAQSFLLIKEKYAVIISVFSEVKLRLYPSTMWLFDFFFYCSDGHQTFELFML